MHGNSFNRMREFRRKLVARGSRVLDVGGADVNGSYRPIFADCEYVTLDRARADVVVNGYDWPLDDQSFDVVISGQCLEHDKFFWLTLKNIARVLRSGGLFLLIVPAQWPIHRYPVDCYRFLPDSIDAIAEWAGMTAIARTIDVGCRGTRLRDHADLVAAFKKP